MTVFVLWENHATGPDDRFGPHAFLVACVADRLRMNRFELQAQKIIRGRSCNGNGNVVGQLGPAERGGRRPLWDAALHLIAVLDSDKLHDLLGGEARKLIAESAYDTWSAQMEARCRERIGPHEAARLTICFIDRNLETLLKILGDTSIEKDVVQRDKVLQRASGDPVLIRRGLEEMPSWANLVEAVATAAHPLVRR
jgi:hypothetical protein